MTTVRDVVTLALQQGRVIGINRTPTASEADRGLVAFQSMLDQWVADGMFGTLSDVYLTASDTAEEGKRYLLASGVTLTMPAIVSGQGGDYGEEGNTTSRQILDLSLVEQVTAAGVRSVQIWDRTAWVVLTPLGLDDDAPLASRGVAGLAASLAKTFCELFGGSPGQNTQMQARRFEGSLSHKFGSTQAKTAGVYF
jgi:hypothetical protein